MSCYIRPRIPGATVFFTVSLAARGSWLLYNEITHLRAAVRQTMLERPFHIDAFVVLPDHLHTVWTLPEGDADYSTRWGAIKARFSMSLRRAGVTPPSVLPKVRDGRYAGVNPGLRKHKGEVAIWQRRFWEHHIRHKADFMACVSQCHRDPITHRLVSRAEDWPYSSIHRNMGDGQFAA